MTTLTKTFIQKHVSKDSVCRIILNAATLPNYLHNPIIDTRLAISYRHVCWHLPEWNSIFHFFIQNLLSIRHCLGPQPVGMNYSIITEMFNNTFIITILSQKSSCASFSMICHFVKWDPNEKKTNKKTDS